MTVRLRKVLDQVKHLVTKDLKQNKLILFGSYAKGKQKEWSDIDVAIVVPAIKNRFKREVDLRVKLLSIDERINPVIISEKELSQISPLIWEIKKYGFEL